MDEEKKEDNPEFGKVIDALHSKQKLPSLRTYQGDMAEFIKNKNESVVSIAIKEKEGKEKKTKEGKKLESYSKKNTGNFQINLTMAVLSLLLIFGGAAVFFYVFKVLKEEPVSKVAVQEEIIPYSNLITLANITNKSLGPELSKLPLSNGISIVKISDTNGTSFLKAQDFFNFLEVILPASLKRTIKNEYALGIISQNNKNSYFIVITANDFGAAFSAMLDWEGNMEKDLSFLNAETDNFIVASAATTTATTTANAATNGGQASTTLIVEIPMKPESFSWKDVIIKNKDTRALMNEKGESRIAYTFLDKNTILITDNISVIGDISSAYASRSVAR
jgi:hypothetical protein